MAQVYPGEVPRALSGKCVLWAWWCLPSARSNWLSRLCGDQIPSSFWPGCSLCHRECEPLLSLLFPTLPHTKVTSLTPQTVKCPCGHPIPRHALPSPGRPHTCLLPPSCSLRKAGSSSLRGQAASPEAGSKPWEEPKCEAGHCGTQLRSITWVQDNYLEI